MKKNPNTFKSVHRLNIKALRSKYNHTVVAGRMYGTDVVRGCRWSAVRDRRGPGLSLVGCTGQTWSGIVDGGLYGTDVVRGCRWSAVRNRRGPGLSLVGCTGQTWSGTDVVRSRRCPAFRARRGPGLSLVGFTGQTWSGVVAGRLYGTDVALGNNGHYRL